MRIAVNQELQQLETLLRQIPDCLADQGTVAIITFHSLEDRIVKDTFRQWKIHARALVISLFAGVGMFRSARQSSERASLLRRKSVC